MSVSKEFQENVKECLENEWIKIKKVFEIAIVEGDTNFMNAFNRKVRRFKYLFIDNN